MQSVQPKPGGKQQVAGCVTQQKYIAGRMLSEIERILGFRAGRLAQGAFVVRLDQLPGLPQFDISGYTNVNTGRKLDRSGVDVDRLKQNARSAWSLRGPNSLEKVIPMAAAPGAPQIESRPEKACPNGNWSRRSGEP
jgi:hypothetical protein